MWVDSYCIIGIDVCILSQKYIPRIGYVFNRDEDRLPLCRKSTLDDVVTIRVDKRRMRDRHCRCCSTSACAFYDSVHDLLGERSVKSIFDLNPLQAGTVDWHLVFSNPKFIGLNETVPIRIKVSKGVRNLHQLYPWLWRVTDRPRRKSLIFRTLIPVHRLETLHLRL
jgi:hypothetical protein